MSEPIQPVKTTVAGFFHATLRLFTPVAAEKGETGKRPTHIEHVITYSGSLHHEGDHGELTTLAQQYLQPLTELGWRVETLQVRKWGVEFR